MRMRSRQGYRFYSYGDACLLFRATMTDAFSFRLIATDGAARRGEIGTPHGAVQHAGLHAGRHAGDGEGRCTPERCARPAPTSCSATPIT